MESKPEKGQLLEGEEESSMRSIEKAMRRARIRVRELEINRTKDRTRSIVDVLGEVVLQDVVSRVGDQ